MLHLRPRANLGEIHVFDDTINDWHSYRLSFWSLKLSGLSRFARSGTSEKQFSWGVSVDRSPCPGNAMNELTLAIDMAHVVRVVVGASENKLSPPSDLGSTPCLGDGTPFGIQLGLGN